jgi:protein gp37
VSKIEWTELTWNPVTGCDRCSPGCDNCYALTMAARLKTMGSAHYQTDGDPRTSGPGFGVQCHEDALEVPMRRRKPTMWFVNSMSDLFHPAVPDEFIVRIWSVMIASGHTFQILTKRPQRMAQLVGGAEFRSAVQRDVHETHGTHMFAGWPYPTIWLGTSIELDRYAFRADHLRATPAAVRFLSCEPLLGPLPSLDLTGIDWVIVGGESGAKARPMHVRWVRDLRDRCVGGVLTDTGVDGDPKFFFKQWGAWRYVWEADVVGPFEDQFPDAPWGCLDLDGTYRGDDVPNFDSCCVQRVGKKRAGRELDGRTWDEMPAVAS